MFDNSTHHHGSFPFFQLPNELQLSIIQQLDAQSILAYRQASRVLASAIDDDIRISYQLELELAGMVDAPPDNENSPQRRLDALRSWTAAWVSGEYPVHEVALVVSQRSNFFMWYYSPPRMAVDIAYIDEQEGSLKIYKTPGTFCGLRAKDYVYHGLDTYVDPQSITGFHVDLVQDLFVWCNGGNSDNPHPTLHFRSIANGFGPHVDTARPTIPSRFIGWFPMFSIQVLGDIIAWSIRGGDIGDQKTDVLVINWKTGVIASRMHLPNRITPMLLTRTQLCLVRSDNMSIYLCTFNPCAVADSAISVLKDSFAALRLPACHDRVVGKAVWGDIGLPPVHPNGNPHHFYHDPTHSLVTVSIDMGYNSDVPGCDPGDTPMETERYLLFIPIHTLLKEYHPTDSYSESATTPLPTSADTSGSEPNRIVPWDRWGPSGTRMVSVQKQHDRTVVSSPSVLGAYAALTTYHPQERQYAVTVYQVHSLAGAASSSPVAQANGGGVELGQEALHPEDDYIKGGMIWKSDIHTVYPYKTATRMLPIHLAAAAPDVEHILLTHDGLVSIRI
ncbi:hypothetical protein C8Q73DRAFT_838702 [Cubamyces lactineus]|nr:hypothetical protein C8Q73DRAFT_838702 [Cubamyces lactineus]